MTKLMYTPGASFFSSISPNLSFQAFSLYGRSASYPPLWNKCPISCHMCQQSL